MQYQDRQTALGSWYGPVGMILHSPPARAISFPLVRTTILGQSVYPDIALHISNYYINTSPSAGFELTTSVVIGTDCIQHKSDLNSSTTNIQLFNGCVCNTSIGEPDVKPSYYYY